jgi:Ring finger domain
MGQYCRSRTKVGSESPRTSNLDQHEVRILIVTMVMRILLLNGRGVLAALFLTLWNIDTVSATMMTTVAAHGDDSPILLRLLERNPSDATAPHNNSVHSLTTLNLTSTAAPTPSPTFPPFNNAATNTGGSGYELVVFLLWYVFLVLCCVIPACCAYRRRRWQEIRLARQQQESSPMRPQVLVLSAAQQEQLRSAWLQASGGNSSHTGTPPSTAALAMAALLQSFGARLLQENGGGNEAVQAERAQLLAAALQGTTLTISTENLVENAAAAASPTAVSGDIEMGPVTALFEDDDDGPDATLLVRIPLNTDSSSPVRTVPGTCSICLSPYVVGDAISWSSVASSTCLHAFHTDCILAWLAKKEAPHVCPVCRQEFCPPVTVTTTTSEPSSAWHQLFAAAAAAAANSNAATTTETSETNPATTQSGTTQAVNDPADDTADGPNLEPPPPTPPAVDHTDTATFSTAPLDSNAQT